MRRDAHAEVEKVLHRLGHRVTPARRRIVRALLEAKDHVSADDLVDSFRSQGARISKATIYRTLLLLKESGLFDAHDFGTGKRLYEPMQGRKHHDHLFCIGCGRIIEFSNEEIERQQELVTRRYCFRVIYHSHKIFGYCERCERGRRGAS